MVHATSIELQAYHVTLLSIPTQVIRDYGYDFCKSLNASDMKQRRFSENSIHSASSLVPSCKETKESCTGNNLVMGESQQQRTNKKSERRLSLDMRKQEAKEKALFRREQITCLEQDILKARSLMTQLKTRVRSNSVAFPPLYEVGTPPNLEMIRSLSLPGDIGAALFTETKESTPEPDVYEV